MTFTTLTFILFLSLVFGGYWLLRRRGWQNLFLVLASYAFYAWWDYRFCALMLTSTLVDFTVGLAIGRTRNRRRRRALLAISVICNLGLLGFFKYFNFFAENLQAMAETLGWRLDPVTLRIILPVGISFYTFQTMSYTIDVFRRKLKPTRAVIDYMAYVAFFPQLVAGPIERATHLLPQFGEARRFDCEKAADGCRQILWGFLKKMVLADNLALIVEAAYAAPGAAGGPELAFATICFAFQIYCDFSAYSDIAIGVARLFGFDLMRNFALPYFSQNVTEFWRRWHISLSTWFRDYVYIPLGGTRCPPLRRSLNVLATFLLSGLWHGASWTFVIWGALNGLGILPRMLRGRKEVLRATDVPGGEGRLPRPRVLLRMLATFGLMCLAWVFFRAATLSDALTVFRAIGQDAFSPDAWGALWENVLDKGRYFRTTMFLLVFLLVEWVQRRHHHPLVLDGWPRPLRWAVYTFLIWFILYQGTRARGPFIYFQF